VSVTRCGLEMIHEPHPHPAGDCDGQPMVTPDLAPGGPVAKLYTVSTTPVPWNWAGLTLIQARELRELIDGFVADYNRAFAVKDGELVPACWPLHEGLARELAAFYAQWVHVFQSGLATPENAMHWYDRWLPGFRTRLPGWLGAHEKCNPTVGHRENWNQAAAKVEAATRPTPMTPTAFEAAVEDALLSYTSSPATLDKAD
jgi:hypothetical protein